MNIRDPSSHGDAGAQRILTVLENNSAPCGEPNQRKIVIIPERKLVSTMEDMTSMKFRGLEFFRLSRMEVLEGNSRMGAPIFDSKKVRDLRTMATRFSAEMLPPLVSA
jgi:hypothetical protein